MTDITTEATPAVVVPCRRLGKKAAKYDPRTLRLASYVQKRKRPKVPLTHNLSRRTLKAFPDLGMMENDDHGVCTIAGLAHAEQAWSTFGGEPRRPTDQEILNAYGAINGGRDEGAAMLDALKLARNEGIGGHKIDAFVAIDPQDHDQVRTAHYLFGNLYVGAMLPRSAQFQPVWDISDGNGSEPGSWGGHAFNIYDTGIKTLAGPTWGEMQKLTWAWWDRYVDEAYVILDRGYIGGDKRSPQGFSFERLLKDLQAL